MPTAGHLLPTNISTCFFKKGGQTMKRKHMKARRDKKIFTQTAKKVKKINVAPKISRGGLRL